MKPISRSDYPAFLAALKARIHSARISAIRSVNGELILLYWDIGKSILEKQRAAGWGDSVVEMLARDLRAEFPDIRGFSARNLWNMRGFFEAYGTGAILQQAVAELRRASKRLPSPRKTQSPTKACDNGENFLQQLVAEIPWGQHLLILSKQESASARLYYLHATAHFGWSRSILLNQIKAGAYERAVKERKTHNFPKALPKRIAEQTDEAMKSRYNLEFLGIARGVKERELENRLVGRLQQFILELGYGFCFVGRQYRLTLGPKEYFVDLLFYHRFLKALVAFDLKIGSFEPEHAGKMDFYLNVLNEKERGPGDNLSIGIILCAEKDDVEVEFALKSKGNPIGVAEYELQSKLPVKFKGHLPNASQLTAFVREVLPTRR